MDIISSLGIIINGEEHIIGWAGGEIMLRSRDSTVKDSSLTDDPDSVKQ